MNKQGPITKTFIELNEQLLHKLRQAPLESVFSV